MVGCSVQARTWSTNIRSGRTTIPIFTCCRDPLGFGESQARTFRAAIGLGFADPQSILLIELALLEERADRCGIKQIRIPARARSKRWERSRQRQERAEKQSVIKHLEIIRLQSCFFGQDETL